MPSFIVYVWDDSAGTRSVMVVSVESPAIVAEFKRWCEEENGWRVEVRSGGKNVWT